MPRITKSQLIKLQKKFKTDAAIGEQFGITRQAIHQLRKNTESILLWLITRRETLKSSAFTKREHREQL